jgi:hypothetical protein
MIINLLLNNWKKILFGGVITIGVGYYLFLKEDITHLKNNIANLKELSAQQKAQIISQNLAYEELQNQMQLRESAIQTLNQQVNIIEGNYKNAQLEIANNRDKLNLDNRITPYWLRLASGDRMPSVSATAKRFNAKESVTEFIIPSAAAAGINDYVNQCEIIANRCNVLIDYINDSNRNYNQILKKYDKISTLN